MVAAQQSDAVFVLDLEDKHIEEGLDAVEAPVHIVAHKKVVGVWWLAGDLEQLQKVWELTVDVAADGNGGANLFDIGFLHEDFLGLG